MIRALAFLLAFTAAGCAAKVKTSLVHGEPIGAYYDGSTFYCRDAQERLWISDGECD